MQTDSRPTRAERLSHLCVLPDGRVVIHVKERPISLVFCRLGMLWQHAAPAAAPADVQQSITISYVICTTLSTDVIYHSTLQHPHCCTCDTCST